jgi:hypothetical protein
MADVIAVPEERLDIAGFAVQDVLDGIRWYTDVRVSTV